VRDAADNATEAALDQTEKAGKKMISRVKDIRKANNDKFKK
jgi:purine nucleoside permease